ncbi:translation initiation factor 2 [Pseudomonas lundensis]|uniref:translation initiation factor 2 n=1 Tax=Pseudomonas lundensis TaxID=86185 RepID=UPI0014832EF4|nr:translation initiation factor 2 [Pseudomonas lundensis]
MKATYCVRLALVGVLTAFSAVAVHGATQPQPPATQSVKSPEKHAASAKKTTKKRAPVASKSKSAREIAKKRLPSAKLDLSLPPEMVKQLQPLGTVPMPKHKPLLPNMFGEKPEQDSPFQLNGRLLSNEMELQLRNEARDRQIEGAALDFQFKQ